VTRTPHGPAVIEFPSELEVLLTRDFEAPLELVFDVFTKPEHVRKSFAPFGEEMTVCEIDLRVGGSYRFVMVTDDGTEMTFRGTYLEIDPPHRTVQTWRFDGWPDVEAVETMDLHESDGVTKLTWMLVFRDQADRDHMKKYDGIEAGFENVANYLKSLVDQEAPAAG
jgi:uncharacterized protein YndB with AHSA1/START domain